MEPAAPRTARHGLRRPRNLILLGLAVLLVGLRIALPSIVRHVAVTQADQALVGRIELDDVGLSLLRGGIELRGLRVFADELPTSPTPGTEAAPAAGVAADPIATFGRLWLRIGWLPLLAKTLEIAEVELEDFTVRLDRAREGAFVLPQPVPAADAAPEPEPAADEGPGWGLLVSSVRLRNGQVGFRDFEVSETPEPFELRIDDVAAQKLAIRLSAEGTEPGHLQLAASIDGGSLALDSQISMLPKGPKADSTIELKGLPVGGSRVYLKRLGWSEIHGLLDLSLQHGFEIDGPHHVKGTAALRDLSIVVPGLERKAVAWSRLEVQLADADLVKRRAEVSSVGLEGLRLVARPNDSKPFPLIQALFGDAAPDAAPAPPPPPPAAASGDPAEAGPAFSWSVTQIDVPKAVLELLRESDVTEIGLDASVKNVSSDPASRLTFELVLTPPAGSLALSGDLTQKPIGFDGRLQIKDLGLPKLFAPIAQPALALVRSGVLNVDWKLAAGAPAGGPAGTDAGAVRVAGPLTLRDLAIADPAAKAQEFGVAWKELALDVKEIYAMGVMPAAEPAAAPTSSGARPPVRGAAAPPPIRVDLDRFRLAQPTLQIVRVPEGILLPPALGGAAAKPAVNADAKTVSTEAAKPQPAGSAAESPQPPAPSPVDLHIAKLALEKGRIQIENRGVQPFHRIEINPLDVSGVNVRFPDTAVEKLQIDARTKDGATLSVRGTIAKNAAQIDANLDGLSLAPFNPYASGSGYGVGGGSASLKSKITLKGEKYDVQSHLLVKQLDVTGDQGESVFQQQFGVPLSVALALLKDLEGNIAIDIPVEGDRAGGAQVGLGSIVGQALAKALVGAITSPLKMISAVAEIGGKVENAAPQAIAFRPGRAELAEGESERLTQLAALLGRAPGLQIHLRGLAGPIDARWLREQALREEIERTSGVVGSVRHVGERNERKIALDVLAKRAQDQDATVPDEVLEWYEQKVGAQTLPASALSTLARARAESVHRVLSTDHGVASERLPIDPPQDTDTAADQPAVALGLGAAARPSAAPAPGAPSAAP